MRMHSGLHAGFQRKSLMYTVEPKGPDLEKGSTKDVDVGHLQIHLHSYTLVHTNRAEIV